MADTLVLNDGEESRAAAPLRFHVFSYVRTPKALEISGIFVSVI